MLFQLYFKRVHTMLSYQHNYHAGSCADVHKHTALAIILAKLITKDKPLCYLETHAGRGIYDLSSTAAHKTQEAKHGILPLLATETVLAPPYLQAIRLTQSTYGKDCYPGSPLIAKTLLRKKDEMHLMELHPQEYKILKQHMSSANIHIHHRDGYEGVLALSPPKIRRGLVLMDPSYEVKSEYAKAADFVLALHRKWPAAVLLLWYPLLQEGYHLSLRRSLEQANLPKFWKQEVMFTEARSRAIEGSGLLCVNLPFSTERDLRQYCLYPIASETS